MKIEFNNMSLLPVTPNDVEEMLTVVVSGVAFLKANLPKIIIATIIVFILFKLTDKVSAKIENRLKIKQLRKNKSLRNAIAKTVNISIKLLILAGFFQFIGVPTNVIVMLLFGIVLVVGFGLKNFLSNVGASVILSLSKIIHIGEYVEVLGVEGTILENQLLHTSILTPDNKIVFIPNKELVSNKIITYDRRKTRRIEIDVYVSYDNNLKEASNIMKKTLKLNKYILEDPEPFIIVKDLEVFYVHMQARGYVKTKDFWHVEWSVPVDIKEDLSAEGIKFPSAEMLLLNSKKQDKIESKPKDISV